LKGRIEHFIGRRAMDIGSIGAETISGLYDKGLIRNYADLYSLTKEELVGLDLTTGDEEKKRTLQDRSAENIIKGIEDSKSRPFERVLFALGIRMVGETVAKKLASHFRNIEALECASVEQLTGVHEIGARIAEQVTEFFADEGNRESVDKLKKAGLQMAIVEDLSVDRSEKLAGKTFLVSGTFSMSRDDLKKMIELNGGRNVSGVSKSLDYLVAGDKMGPEKLKKATDFGIQIISEDDLKKLLQ
jgi:DNA ligase (NAD+)